MEDESTAHGRVNRTIPEAAREAQATVLTMTDRAVVMPNTFCWELTDLRGMVFVEQELCKRPSKPSVTDNLQLYRL